jgi:hypothetical protein
VTGPILVVAASGAFLIGLIASSTGATHPTRVEFGGTTYEVEYDDHIWLSRRGERVRDLGYGQQLLQYDFDGDATLDLGVFSDERDGFRDTFAYLDIWSNDGRSLADAAPVNAKWKEGHWAWIDVSHYPALDGRTIWGWLFHSFMREQDRRNYWF